MRKDSGEAKNLYEVGLQASEVGMQHMGLREVIDELASLLRPYEPGRFQLFHVVRERSRADIDTVAHVAARGSTGMRPELFQNLVPPRVSQRTGNQVNLILGELDLLGGSHWHWMSLGSGKALGGSPAQTRRLGFSLLVHRSPSR